MISKQLDRFAYFRIKDHRYHKYCGMFYKGVFVITNIKEPYLRSLLRHCDPKGIIHNDIGHSYLNEPWVKYVVINDYLVSFLRENDPETYFTMHVGTKDNPDPTQFLEMFNLLDD